MHEGPLTTTTVDFLSFTQFIAVCYLEITEAKKGNNSKSPYISKGLIFLYNADGFFYHSWPVLSFRVNNVGIIPLNAVSSKRAREESS